jgi:GIY-YIG catalytic domain
VARGVKLGNPNGARALRGKQVGNKEAVASIKALGNAEGSTLRRTPGCLLSAQLSIQLRRVGSGVRYTFTNPGEQLLDQWMGGHAFVTWVEIDAPWQLEEHLLSSGLILIFRR